MRCRSQQHGDDFVQDRAIAHTGDSIGAPTPLLDACIPPIAILMSWRLQNKQNGTRVLTPAAFTHSVRLRVLPSVPRDIAPAGTVVVPAAAYGCRRSQAAHNGAAGIDGFRGRIHGIDPG